jgi:hypothetical protein
MDLLLHPQTVLSTPWVSIGWLLGGAYTTFRMYQLFVEPYTGNPPGPIKLLINTGLIITIPVICFFSWPILLGTMIGMGEESLNDKDSSQ